jgi:hypothetical protein
VGRILEIEVVQRRVEWLRAGRGELAGQSGLSRLARAEPRDDLGDLELAGDALYNQLSFPEL